MKILEKDGVPAPHIAAMQDGNVQLTWNRTTRRGRLEIEVRIQDEGDELMIGYAHVAGFDFHDQVRDLYTIAKRIRDRIESEST
jgi:hypothetical protein